MRIGIDIDDTMADIEELQRNSSLQIPGDNYDPDKFTFHMTLHIDKDKKLVNKIKEDIKN